MSNTSEETNAKSQCYVISTSEQLRKAIASLESEAFVTIDTEFIRERTYWPVLCLVQLGGQGCCYLIDTLAEDLDTAPLRHFLCNMNIVKVFHAARQDLEIFYHYYNVLPRPVYDTQVAAMVAGLGDQISYANLVQILLQHRIDKGQRYTDWSHRPLSKAQHLYAAEDVTWLRGVYISLEKRIRDFGRQSWVQEEMQPLSDPSYFEPHPERFFRRIAYRLRTSNRHKLGLVKQLVQFREKEAQRRDIPRQYVLKDEQIYAIALKEPRNIKALSSLRGLSSKLATSSIGGKIIDIVHKIQAMDPPSLPSLPDIKGPPKEEAPKEMLYLLRSLLELCGRRYEVSPRLIADSALLEKIAHDPKKIPLVFKGWRWRVFGEKAQALCAKHIALYMNGEKVRILPIQ